MALYRLGKVKKGTRDIVVRYFFGAPTWIASPGLPPTPETEKKSFFGQKQFWSQLEKTELFYVDDVHFYHEEELKSELRNLKELTFDIWGLHYKN